MINAVIYSRVSSESERQDTERQTSELIDYAHRMGYNINKVYEEKASGYKKNEDRPVFTKMLEDINANQIDKVLVWELSRIGRSVLQSLQNIQTLHDMRVGIYIKNFNKVDLEDVFKEQMKLTVNGQSTRLYQDQTVLKKRFKELKTKKETLDSRFAFGEIDKELYNRFIGPVISELIEIEEKLDDFQIKISNLDKKVLF